MALLCCSAYCAAMSKAARDTYRHGNIKADAIKATYEAVAASGHANVSLRRIAEELGVAHRALYNHFKNKEDLLDAVATEAFNQLAAKLRRAKTPKSYLDTYMGFAFETPPLYALMTSRPHGTMKNNPALQRAVHGVITEALRIFADPEASSQTRRRQVMRVYILAHGALSLYSAGILDLPGRKALIAEVAEMLEGQ